MTIDVNPKAFESSDEGMDDEDMFEDIEPTSKVSFKEADKADEDDDEEFDDIDAELEEEEIDEDEEVDEAEDEDVSEDTEKPEAKTDNKDDEAEKAESRSNRRIRQLVEEKNTYLSELEKLRQENSQLKKQSKSNDRKYAEDRKDAIDSYIGTLEERLATAIRDGDIETQVKINSELTKAAVDKKALDTYLSYELDDDGEDEQPQAKTSTPQSVDRELLLERLPEKARNWATKNKWFGVNTQLTRAVLEIGTDLTNEGFGHDEDEYYTNLDERLAEQFPSRFKKQGEAKKEEKEEAVKPKPKVGTGSKTTIRRKTGKKRLPRLTEEERQMAYTLGVSEKAYAREKAGLGDYQEGQLVEMD